MAATPEQALKMLIDACDLMRQNVSFQRSSRRHEIYADHFQSWSKQVKEAKKALKGGHQ